MMAATLNTHLSLSPGLHPGYQLVRLRGVGGFGEVWEAETKAGKPVALKFLPGAGRRGAARELRSIQLVQGLEHPNLIRIERVWCAEGFLVIAMELADGSLGDLLDVYLAEFGDGLPCDHLLPLMSQAAQAIDFLNQDTHVIHGERVAIQHCDINPFNILVFGKTVKLSDFSLTTTLTGRQKVHFRAGTPDYAAPEVFQGRVTERTDQYALAVCYCALRGARLPFPDTPPNFEGDYTRPAPDLTMLSEAERPIIARALSPVPHDRWPSCVEMIAALQRRTTTPDKTVRRV